MDPLQKRVGSAVAATSPISLSPYSPKSYLPTPKSPLFNHFTKKIKIKKRKKELLSSSPNHFFKFLLNFNQNRATKTEQQCCRWRLWKQRSLPPSFCRRTKHRRLMSSYPNSPLSPFPITSLSTPTVSRTSPSTPIGPAFSSVAPGNPTPSPRRISFAARSPPVYPISESGKATS